MFGCCELYPVLFRIFGIFLTLHSPQRRHNRADETGASVLRVDGVGSRLG